jgi:hypothetical protein
MTQVPREQLLNRAGDPGGGDDLASAVPDRRPQPAVLARATLITAMPEMPGVLKNRALRTTPGRP